MMTTEAIMIAARAANVSTDERFAVRPIATDAIHAILKSEYENGLSICSSLFRHKGEASIYDEGVSCGDFYKCVMGAIICGAGYSIKQAWHLPSSITGWDIYEFRAIWAKFGLSPKQCFDLMLENDTEHNSAYRYVALVAKVKNLLPQALPSIFLSTDNRVHNLYIANGWEYEGQMNTMDVVARAILA